MDAYEKILLPNNILLKRCFDPEPNDPRDWDNLGTMIHWHRRSVIGDKSLKDAGFEDGFEFEKFIKKDGGVYLPVYLYEHSGMTVATTPFDCQWDSGQVGYIYADTEAIRKEYSCKRITAKIREKVEGVLKSEVEAYDDFLTGRCYGFVVELLDADEVAYCDGDERAIKNLDGEHLDSCWGFYGKEYFEEESMDRAKHYAEVEIPQRVLANCAFGAGI
jgi:hypothetical protein